jgi:hypothetical protein
MRYAIRTHGIIYITRPDTVGEDLRNELVERVRREYGAFRVCGDVVPGGWWNAVEPVNERVFGILMDDYPVVVVE